MCHHKFSIHILSGRLEFLMIFGAFTDWDFTYWWYSLAARLEWYLGSLHNQVLVKKVKRILETFIYLEMLFCWLDDSDRLALYSRVCIVWVNVSRFGSCGDTQLFEWFVVWKRKTEENHWIERGHWICLLGSIYLSATWYPGWIGLMGRMNQSTAVLLKVCAGRNGRTRIEWVDIYRVL